MAPGSAKDSDNPSRRSGIERRKLIYTYHIPEKRSGKDRRFMEDRKAILGSLKNKLEKIFKNLIKQRISVMDALVGPN